MARIGQFLRPPPKPLSSPLNTSYPTTESRAANYQLPGVYATSTLPLPEIPLSTPPHITTCSTAHQLLSKTSVDSIECGFSGVIQPFRITASTASGPANDPLFTSMSGCVDGVPVRSGLDVGLMGGGVGRSIGSMRGGVGGGVNGIDGMVPLYSRAPFGMKTAQGASAAPALQLPSLPPTHHMRLLPNLKSWQEFSSATSTNTNVYGSIMNRVTDVTAPSPHHVSTTIENNNGVPLICRGSTVSSENQADIPSNKSNRTNSYYGDIRASTRSKSALGNIESVPATNNPVVSEAVDTSTPQLDMNRSGDGAHEDDNNVILSECLYDGSSHMAVAINGNVLDSFNPSTMGISVSSNNNDNSPFPTKRGKGIMENNINKHPQIITLTCKPLHFNTGGGKFNHPIMNYHHNDINNTKVKFTTLSTNNFERAYNFEGTVVRDQGVLPSEGLLLSNLNSSLVFQEPDSMAEGGGRGGQEDGEEGGFKSSPFTHTLANVVTDSDQASSPNTYLVAGNGISNVSCTTSKSSSEFVLEMAGVTMKSKKTPCAPSVRASSQQLGSYNSLSAMSNHLDSISNSKKFIRGLSNNHSINSSSQSSCSLGSGALSGESQSNGGSNHTYSEANILKVVTDYDGSARKFGRGEGEKTSLRFTKNEEKV
eukprot:CAMPEP_0175042162 /NCGR_PEP_ID=MMETSP0052_2-20121109/2383_1 /TAXON_ID=51329 ORGANISM="Polytomella parva, Strain SAG 63-3" /NCGR_SAMPLE_ID=MMETSP0052_2 /ASSEMBLY_ACC=CAM_ASM_000194 /LENGTH=651 /DNA_ID=CAMNT_0016304889 /DNA_START=477 /DNA_END=2432 /DNA_ORIENTATION=-